MKVSGRVTRVWMFVGVGSVHYWNAVGSKRGRIGMAVTRADVDQTSLLGSILTLGAAAIADRSNALVPHVWEQEDVLSVVV